MSFVNSITIEVYCIQPFISIRKHLLILNPNLTDQIIIIVMYKKLFTNRWCNLVCNKWFQTLKFRFLLWRCHQTLISMWFFIVIRPFNIYYQRTTATTTHDNCDLFCIRYVNWRLNRTYYIWSITTTNRLGKTRATTTDWCRCFTYINIF